MAGLASLWSEAWLLGFRPVRFDGWAGRYSVCRGSTDSSWRRNSEKIRACIAREEDRSCGIDSTWLHDDTSILYGKEAMPGSKVTIRELGARGLRSRSTDSKPRSLKRKS